MPNDQVQMPNQIQMIKGPNSSKGRTGFLDFGF
jgi:hypothetical protein